MKFQFQQRRWGMKFVEPRFSRFCCEPEQFGFERVERSLVTTSSLSESIELVQKILNGQEVGPARNMVMMSSGVSLYLCGLSDSLENGVKEVWSFNSKWEGPRDS